MILSITLVYNVGFKDLVEYVGVILSIFSVLVVLGVPILRSRDKLNTGIYSYWEYNLFIFSFVNIYMIFYIFDSDINKLLYVLMTILVGYIIYLFVRKTN